jgi:hypothetical protein
MSGVTGSGFRRRALTTGMMILAVLLLALPAAASAEWGASVNLSGEHHSSSQPTLGVSEDGETVAVWRDFAREPGVRFEGLQSRSKAPGGSWGPEVALPVSTEENMMEPQVAMDKAGDAIAIWARVEGRGSTVVQASERSPGGTWKAPVDLSAPGIVASQLRIAADAAGDAVAIWNYFEDNEELIGSSSLSAGGTWGPVVNLSDDGRPDEAEVAMNDAGDAIVVWSTFTGSPGGNQIHAAIRRGAGGTWGAPTTVASTGQWTLEPDAALDSAGNATVVWKREPTQIGGGQTVIQAVTKAAGASGWGAATRLSTGSLASAPQVETDANGDAFAVWKAGEGSVQAASKPAGALWGPAVNIAKQAFKASAPLLAVDPKGDAYAIWTQTEASVGGYRTYAANMPAGSSWQAPVSLGESTSYGLQIGVDGEGNATVLWRLLHDATGEERIEATEFDNRQPVDELPQLSHQSVTPNLWGGGGGTSKISTTATDDHGVTRVYAVVTTPRGEHTEVPLTAVGSDRYEATFTTSFNPDPTPSTDTVAIFAEDTAGQTAGGPAGAIQLEPKGTPNPGYLTVEPAVLRFGSHSIAAGEATVRSFVLSNPGKAGSPAVTGVLSSSDPQFTVVGGEGGSLAYSIAPGASQTIEVAFKPTARNQQSATLTLNRTDGRQGAATVSLFGWGLK